MKTTTEGPGGHENGMDMDLVSAERRDLMTAPFPVPGGLAVKATCLVDDMPMDVDAPARADTSRQDDPSGLLVHVDTAIVFLTTTRLTTRSTTTKTSRADAPTTTSAETGHPHQELYSTGQRLPSCHPWQTWTSRRSRKSERSATIAAVEVTFTAEEVEETTSAAVMVSTRSASQASHV
jgi:hypothetical protein